MTNTIAVFYDERFVQYNLGSHHPLHQERIQLHYELCRTLGMLGAPIVKEPNFTPATEDHLRLVHTQDYIDRVRKLSKQEGYALLDHGDTPSFPGAYDVARLMVGATIASVDAVMTGQV